MNILPSVTPNILHHWPASADETIMFYQSGKPDIILAVLIKNTADGINNKLCGGFALYRSEFDEFISANYLLEDTAGWLIKMNSSRMSTIGSPVPPPMYKDYKSVDALHVQRLSKNIHYSFTHQKLADITGETDILFGVATLPGNFVVASDYNKTAAGREFNLDLGTKYLKENLSNSVDKKLWEFEGYRVMRNVHTIDSQIANSADPEAAQRAVKFMANGALPIYFENTVFLVIVGNGYNNVIEQSRGEIYYGIGYIERNAYIAIQTLLDTYITKS